MKLTISNHELFNVKQGHQIVLVDTPLMYVVVQKLKLSNETCYCLQSIFNTNEIHVYARKCSNYNMVYSEKCYMHDLKDPETVYNIIYQQIHKCELDIAKQTSFVKYMYEHNIIGSEHDENTNDLEDSLISFLENEYCHNLLEDCYSILHEASDFEMYEGANDLVDEQI